MDERVTGVIIAHQG